MNRMTFELEVPNIIGIRFVFALIMLILAEIQILYLQVKLKILGRL